MKSCGWQGLGFGASYEDAGCVGGYACDLDDCEHTEDGVMVTLRDELCPQCKGTGDIIDGERGVTALYRQRAHRELKELVDDIGNEELSELIMTHHIDPIFSLIRKLEEHDS